MTRVGFRRGARWYQFEHWILREVGRESVGRGAGRDRKVTLHGELEAVEIVFENRGFLPIRHGAESEFADRCAVLERHASARFGVEHPLRASARAYEEGPAIIVEYVDRRRIDLSTFAAAHLQQIVVLQPDAEADEQAENAVKHAFERARLEKNGAILFHVRRLRDPVDAVEGRCGTYIAPSAASALSSASENPMRDRTSLVCSPRRGEPRSKAVMRFLPSVATETG